MKTIEQLLELSKNPYYKFTPSEQAVLDDFLLKQRESHSTDSAKKNSNESDKKTRVTVHNVVPKVIDRVQDAPEPTDAA